MCASLLKVSKEETLQPQGSLFFLGGVFFVQVSNENETVGICSLKSSSDASDRESSIGKYFNSL